MDFMLDTNICIYIAKQKPPQVEKKFATLAVGQVGMSVVTYGEMLYGANRSNSQEKAKRVLNELIQLIPVLEMKTETALHYADIRADLAVKGQMIGNNDLWIAAHARAIGKTLVTNNTREFDRVSGLVIENWVGT